MNPLQPRCWNNKKVLNVPCNNPGECIDHVGGTTRALVSLLTTSVEQHRTFSTAGMYVCCPFVYPIFWGWAPPLPLLAGHAEISLISSVTSFLLRKAPPLLVLAGYAKSTCRPGSVVGLTPKIYHAKYSLMLSFKINLYSGLLVNESSWEKCKL